MTLKELIERNPIGMMTTRNAQGELTSRPMRAVEAGNGRVWFLTRADSDKVREIGGDAHVNLAFVGSEGEYASVTGRAEIARDRRMVERLWDPTYRAWFPDGVDDPDLLLLHLNVDRADYWQDSSSRAYRIVEAVKSTVTGAPSEIKKQKIDL